MTGIEFGRMAMAEMDKTKAEIIKKYNYSEVEKEDFENAILEYDYLQNEGVYWQSKEDLITSCYGKEVDNRLEKGLAEYIKKLNEVYIGNAFMPGYRNTENITSEILGEE